MAEVQQLCAEDREALSEIHEGVCALRIIEQQAVALAEQEDQRSEVARSHSVIGAQERARLALEAEVVQLREQIARAQDDAELASLRRSHERAVLDACKAVPAEAVGKWGASPGEPWEPVRLAIRAWREAERG